MFKVFEKIQNNDVYIIAEMSANHGGKLENALEIVNQAAKIGVDCVKIQTYTPDSITVNCKNDYFKIKGGLWDGYNLYDLYKKAYTPYEWDVYIKDECEKCGIDFLSTPFDKNAVDFLEELGVEAYKIASFELVDIPLIEYVASKGKPIIISCGMGSINEIQDAVDACRNMNNNKIILLKCCSEYPSNWEDMFLANIPDMKKRFKCNVGLSDHSIGSLAAIVGTTIGACVIEKHIKLPGIESEDSEFSMTIDDFEKMIKDVRSVKSLTKGPNYSLTSKEKESTAFRRSLFAVKNIKKGDVLTYENVRSIRPNAGVEPKYLKQIIGKKAPFNVEFGNPITKEFVDLLLN